MDDRDWLTARFEAARPHRRATVCRLRGSDTEANDGVQETWLGLGGTDMAPVDHVGGRSTMVTEELDPQQQTLLADRVGSALLVVLQREVIDAFLARVANGYGCPQRARDLTPLSDEEGPP